MSKCKSITVIVFLSYLVTVPAHAATLTFINDFASWSAAAGVTNVIDFETLPNGSTSYAGAAINASNNYTSQGVTFSAPDALMITGNPTSGYNLTAGTIGFAPTYIIADLVSPTSAVGIFFPGGTSLSAFDINNNLIADVSFFSGGTDFFLGIVSDTLIHSAMVNRGSSIEAVLSFRFATPVPEPATVVLMGLALIGLLGLGWHKRYIQS